MNIVTIASIVVGLLLLVVGRKAFWFFLALVGFAVAVAFVPQLFPDLDGQTQFVVAIVVGIAAGAAAAVLAKVVVWVGGFVGGAYVGVIAWQTLVPAAPGFPWIPVVAGGIAGMLLAKFLFESVLVVVSSAAGASLIVHTIGVGESTGFVLLILLTAIGIIVQGRLWPRASSSTPAKENGENQAS
jgi:hypothetical protein